MGRHNSLMQPYVCIAQERTSQYKNDTQQRLENSNNMLRLQQSHVSMYQERMKRYMLPLLEYYPSMRRAQTFCLLFIVIVLYVRIPNSAQNELTGLQRQRTAVNRALESHRESPEARTVEQNESFLRGRFRRLGAIDRHVLRTAGLLNSNFRRNHS